MSYRSIDSIIKAKTVALLQSHWRPDVVANRSYCHVVTAYRWEGRIQKYGTSNLLHRLRTERSPRLHEVVKQNLLESAHAPLVRDARFRLLAVDDEWIQLV